MEKQIWKYEISPSNTTIKMPKHAEVLSVQEQNGLTCIWVLINPKNESKDYFFEIFATGQPIPTNPNTMHL